MLDIFTIALFQLVTVFGYTPTSAPYSNDATVTTSEVGSGGWGHDITCNDTTPAPAPTVGSGGWGHD